MQKIDIARRLLPGLLRNPNLTRAEIIERLKQAAQVTHSTAVSYYERIAKELGQTNKERGPGSSSDVPIGGVDSNRAAPSGSFGADFGFSSSMSSAEHRLGNNRPVSFGNALDPERELEGMDTDNPNRIGIIRRVDGAHLVFKRQMTDSSFEELWIFKLDPLETSIKIKQNILAGTDIPHNAMRSPDGTQKYELKTMGDAQMLHIIGLPN